MNLASSLHSAQDLENHGADETAVTQALPHFIEILRRSGELRARSRVEALPLTVGRALDNDIIVDDPYVAAHHLRVEADAQHADKFRVIDLGSTNGLYANGKRVGEARIARGQSVRFGHSLLRLRTASDPVPAERRDYSSRRALSPMTAMMLLLATTLIAAIAVPLQQFGDIGPQVWLSSVLMPIGVLLGWAAAWAGLSKLTVGRAHFWNHLAIAGWAVVIMEVLEDLLQLASFSVAAPGLQAAIPPMYVVVTALMLTAHLSLVQTRRPSVNLPVAAILACLPLAVFMLNNWDAQRAVLPTDIYESIYPSSIRIAPPRSLDSALTAMEGVRKQADEVRDAVDEHDVMVLPNDE